MSIGMCIGIALGALFDDVATGVALGMALVPHLTSGARMEISQFTRQSRVRGQLNYFTPGERLESATTGHCFDVKTLLELTALG